MMTDDTTKPPETRVSDPTDCSPRVLLRIDAEMKRHHCYGSWWSFDNKFPDGVVDSLCAELGINREQFLLACERLSSKAYHDNKPDLSLPGMAACWG